MVRNTIEKRDYLVKGVLRVECIKTAIYGKDSRILKEYMTSNEYNKFLNTL